MGGGVLPARPVAPNDNLCLHGDTKIGDEPLGSLARRLEARALRRRSLKRRLQRRIEIRLLDALRILWYASRLARRLRAETGISVKQQLMTQLDLAFRRGIDPSLYYLHELYKPGALDRVDEYLTRHEVKGALLRRMHRLQPPADTLRINLGDKLQFTRYCAKADLAHVAPLMLIEGGEITWHTADFDALDQDLFVKPRVSRGARGATLYRRVTASRYADAAGRAMTLGGVVSDLIRRFGNTNLMILPRLRNHPGLSGMASDSLITIRAVTCLDEQQRPELTIAYLRILTKLEPKWAVAKPIAEYAAAIDLQTGRLSEMTGDQPECLSAWYERHPVTGTQVLGRIVPHWAAVVRLALEAHQVASDRVLVGWDIAITPEGPVLLEGNSYPDVHYPQRIYKQPYGTMRIGELLRFYMRRLEQTWSIE